MMHGQHRIQPAPSARNTSASRYLRQGVGSARCHFGQGELEAVATNGTQAGRQTNRRIEVTIYAAAQR
jgi:flagellar motor protein MotB